ncbi:MAG: HU domain-containing protein [Paludibacter sp.]
MEKICQYIEILLAQHDYVVVPNLGGFVVQTKSAEIFSDRIIPPLTTIGFNPLMLHSDGLLAIEIARSEAISYREALEFIDKEVGKIKNQLNTTGIARLANLGQMKLNSSGNILFSPDLKADFLPLNIGLKEVYIVRENKQPKAERTKVTFTLPSTRMYKYAAACILVFSLMFVTPKLNDKRHLNSADLLSGISIKTIDSSFTEPQVAVIDTLSSDTMSVLSEAQSVVTDTITLKNYHVIVASLRSKKMADTYCKVLADNHFDQVHVLPPDKLYRIAIKSFSDKKMAIKYMEDLRKSDRQFESAWVLCDN